MRYMEYYMHKFKQYVTESRQRLETTADVIAAIKMYDDEPEILNPVFNNIKDNASRHWDKAKDVLHDAIIAYQRANGEKDAALTDLYYDIPYSYTSMKKMRKSAEKVTVKQLKDQAIAMADLWDEIGSSLKALKGKVVKVSTKRAEAKAEAQKQERVKRGSYESLIKALESHRSEYLKQAEAVAKKHVDGLLAMLKKHNMDLNQLAPRGAYSRELIALRDVMYRITTSKSDFRAKEDIRVVYPKGVASFIEESMKNAQVEYDSFISKMVLKVGKPVASATLTGSIWTNASLKVETEDGENQVWVTRMIINFSKYQRMFNQFRTNRK